MENYKTWADVIEYTMINNNYYATLKYLHSECPKLKSHKGKTPDMTINYILQTDDRFIKIQPGLWALKKYINNLPYGINPKDNNIEEITHSLLQGYLIEIGNEKDKLTFTPDKSRIFLNKRLKDIIKIEKCPDFTYDKIINSIKYIDVIWFNDRLFPDNIIEVEHSTNFRNSLLKFMDLQDFNTKMTMVAEKDRKDAFLKEIGRPVFASIKNKVTFIDYDEVVSMYSSYNELKTKKHLL